MAKQAKTTRLRAGADGRLILPSNLAWRRSINVSEGEMFAVILAPDGGQETRVPVEVVETTVRGAMANYSAGYDKAGKPLDDEALAKAQNPTNPNIQTVQGAALPSSSDTLEVAFSVAFSGDSAAPEACNSIEYRSILGSFQAAARTGGLHAELAARYLWSLVNGRVLWRNGYGVDRQVHISPGGLTFDCAALPMDRFPGAQALSAAANDAVAATQLIEDIGVALAGGDMLALQVRARVRLYPGAEVWPSQEFASKEAKQRKGGGEISRILSSKPARLDGRDIRHATMHSQKIGNAIRTIDEWHGEQAYDAIPVEAFGWVQRDQAAIRRPDVNDAYTTLRDLNGLTEALAAGDADQRDAALYTLAVMIRGGVYVMSSAGTETAEEAA